MRLSQERIEEIRAALAKMPGGPWVAYVYDGKFPTKRYPREGQHIYAVCRDAGDDNHECLAHAHGENEARARETAEYFAETREYITDLLSEVDRLRETVQNMNDHAMKRAEREP